MCMSHSPCWGRFRFCFRSSMKQRVGTEGCLIGFTSEADEIDGCGTNTKTARIAGSHIAEPNCRIGTRICGIASLSLSQSSFRIMHFLGRTSMRHPKGQNVTSWDFYVLEQGENPSSALFAYHATHTATPDWSSYAEQRRAHDPAKLPRTSLSSTF